MSNQNNHKILFVITSVGTMGESEKPTGYRLNEVTHPWKALHDAGYEVDFVSPLGGESPVTGFNLDDEINKEFWENEEARAKIENTMIPEEINPGDYIAIFFAGGHGTMWDFPENEELQNIARTVYENGGIIAAICHGPSALVNLKLSNGKYLVEGKRINSYTNEEEEASKLSKVVPFLLESKLKERGADFKKSGIRESHVEEDERIITGQNSVSAEQLGVALLNAVEKKIQEMVQ